MLQVWVTGLRVISFISLWSLIRNHMSPGAGTAFWDNPYRTPGGGGGVTATMLERLCHSSTKDPCSYIKGL